MLQVATRVVDWSKPDFKQENETDVFVDLHLHLRRTVKRWHADVIGVDFLINKNLAVISVSDIRSKSQLLTRQSRCLPRDMKQSREG